MKVFKKIDCIVQVVLLLIAVCWNLTGIAHGKFMGDQPFIMTYLIIGGWQLMSFIAHLSKPQYNKKILRGIYLLAVLAVIVGAIICYLHDTVLVFFYLLLFTAPLIAMYYCTVCMVETKPIKNTASTE